jgi:isopenicillin N synthase-like dioxygenase
MSCSLFLPKTMISLPFRSKTGMAIGSTLIRFLYVFLSIADLRKGTFVINIADCMARWTNDIFQSTIHRAINRSGVERYSVPMFFGVDYECTIDVRTCPYFVSDTIDFTELCK